jgi:hypothetical protein
VLSVIMGCRHQAARRRFPRRASQLPAAAGRLQRTGSCGAGGHRHRLQAFAMTSSHRRRRFELRVARLSPLRIHHLRANSYLGWLADCRTSYGSHLRGPSPTELRSKCYRRYLTWNLFGSSLLAHFSDLLGLLRALGAILSRAGPTTSWR